jgi:hypothetical protein
MMVFIANAAFPPDLFRCESGEAVAAARGDEVDGVVAVPVFKSMLVSPVLEVGF